MDPNQPASTAVAEPQPEPTPAPAQPQPASIQPEPVAAVPQAFAGMKHSRKGLVTTIVMVLVLLGVAGGAIAYLKYYPQTKTKSTPTPAAVVTDDIKRVLPDIDSSMKEAEINISTITASLDDTQGDLSE